MHASRRTLYALGLTLIGVLALPGCYDRPGPTPRLGSDVFGVDISSGDVGDTLGDVANDVPSNDGPTSDVVNDVPSNDTLGDAINDVPSNDTPGDVVNDVPSNDTPGDVPNDVPSNDTLGDVPNDVPSNDTLGDVLNDVPSSDTPSDTPDPPMGCTTLTPSGTGTCTIAAGDPNKTLLLGNLVLPNGIQEAGQLLIVNGSITCVGCDCAAHANAATATVITCAEGVISPGLINAHDHITWAQDTPKNHGVERYEHRHEWRKGLNGKTKITTFQNIHALGDGWGEMRQAMAGTTSLFGSGGEGGFLRNLDRANLLEGISHPAGDYSTFPLGDSNGALYNNGCGGYSPDDPTVAASESAYVPHVAEGIIAAARNEFLCASGDQSLPGSVDFTNDNAAFIHGIGMTTADIGLMASQGTALVWSPRSNTDLYGMTANAPIYDRLGALITLGTDWMPTGSMHLLRELACAESWNDYWDNHFSDADLIAMVTHNAAEALGFADVLGSLSVGKVADIAIWNASTNSGYRAILDAEPADVVLVMRGGLPLYGDAPLVEGTTSVGDCEPFDVCGSDKSVCTHRELGVYLPNLINDLGNLTSELFACGAPANEPSCVPARPGEYDGISAVDDSDGDGISNASDNCPNVFNPTRPVDGDVQVDADEDGIGDECDPCPFDADTTACSSIDPLDIDSDGVAIPSDNCALSANTDQADADGDGAGDECDPCPLFFNPGGGVCPATIYGVKDGTIGVGEGVLIQGALVTAVGSSFIVAQVDPADAGYQGPENSGLYVHLPEGPLPMTGDRVDIDGSVNDYYGQLQLSNAAITVTQAGAGVPPATAVTAADLTTGTGANASEYEALLVVASGLTVTDLAPTGVSGEVVQGEFEVEGGLPVDDLLYLIDPAPALDQVIPSITGIVRFSWNRNKLCPRSAPDVGLGGP